MADQNIRLNEKREQSRCPPYTSKIIKAGASLADTKTLLSHWDVQASIWENLDRLRRENVLGKASRSRVQNVLGMRFTMETTTSRDTLTTSPLLTPEERLKLWQRFKGMWKNRTPDPIEELEKMRKEWERELPPDR